MDYFNGYSNGRMKSHRTPFTSIQSLQIDFPSPISLILLHVIIENLLLHNCHTFSLLLYFDLY